MHATDDEVGAFSCIVLPSDAPGIEWTAGWSGMGMRGNESRAMRLTNAYVKGSNLLGSEGDQLWYIFNVVAPCFLMAMAGTYLSLARSAFDDAISHIKKRSYALETARPAMYTDATLEAGDYAQLRVRDTGCGMDAAVLQRLFEPFFSTKRLGRGLSAVIGILKAHRGELSVTSEVGVGTEFRVLIPLAATRVASDERGPVSLKRPKERRRVLVVDDEEPVREFAARALRELGYEVDSASDGALGLGKLSGEVCCDVVLLDYSMPGLCGEQFMREAQVMGIEVPIVLCSGYSDINTNELSEYRNPRRFLSKPYGVAELASRIHEALIPKAEESGTH